VHRRLRAAAALALALCAAGLASEPARAGTQTLKRSFENLTLWPLDLALSPVVAGRTLYTNLRDIEDTDAVRIAYPIPGYVWLTAVQAGAAVLRGVTGVFELVPGLILLPFEAEVQVLYDPADENESLVDIETPVYRIKFGVNYTGVPY
jgi:hypothetical protein